jgi:hypothetical protein
MISFRRGAVGLLRLMTESLLLPPIVKTSPETLWKPLISAPPTASLRVPRVLRVVDGVNVTEKAW